MFLHSRPLVYIKMIIYVSSTAYGITYELEFACSNSEFGVIGRGISITTE